MAKKSQEQQLTDFYKTMKKNLTQKGKKVSRGISAKDMRRIESTFRNAAQSARYSADDIPAIKVLKPAKKSIARKIVGKVVGAGIPGVGAAIVAKDVIKGVSKATCSRRGGKWVSGKCVGTTKSIFGKKKTKFKKGAQVRDPISKR